MPENDKEKTFLQKFGKEKFGEKLMNMNNPIQGGFMPEPTPPTMVMPQMDSEEERFDKMVELNGKQYDNGDRSQGDQEAEQRMVQNKKTGLLQKFVNMVTSPFSSALEKEFGTEDQPKFGGKDGVMYNGQFVHPDFYKLIMNRPDLKERFDRTGSIYGE